MAEKSPEPTDAPGSRWGGADTVRSAAYWVIVLAGSWWLLGQLATVMRPLLLAAFLGYVLLPYYSRLRQRMPPALAIGLLAGVTAVVVAVLALTGYASLIGLTEELPQLKGRATGLLNDANTFVDRQATALGLPIDEGEPAPPAEPGQPTPPKSAKHPRQDAIVERALAYLSDAANVAAGGLLEMATAGLYLMFLLIGAERLPNRVREAYPPERADHILNVAGRINAAIISYLKAKVKSSLILAVPVGIVLAVFGVKFALLWAVLTFLCNFIPYIGTAVAYTLPVGFAFLQLELGYRPVTVAVLLLACHLGSAMVVEPMILGRAVGLSPLVILAALTVWGLVWGIPGMFLAVPLTVVVKIVFENIEQTRPVASLLGGE
jgi:AI-2 transport protein TqsA